MAPSFLEPLLIALRNLADVLPTKDWFKRPQLNFLSLHYIYILSMTIAGSIIIYGATNMAYVDALFFAAGSATQSGLNTIDVNQVLLYQQITFMLIACVTNPIFINTVVVYVRLYWFEKRFKDLVIEARSRRTTWQKSRSKSEAKADNSSRVEQGVRGRSITVLHDTTRPNGMTSGDDSHTKDEAAQFAKKMGLSENRRAVDSAESSSQGSHKQQPESEGTTLASEEPPPMPHRTITFPEELPTPGQPDVAQHIAIVQRQQQDARSEGGTLRIPGPRDFERGEVPKEIDDTDMSPVKRKDTHDSEVKKVSSMLDDNDHNVHSPRHAITFNEPNYKPTHGRRSEDDEKQSSKDGKLSRLLRQRSGKSDRKGTFARSLTNLSNALTQTKSQQESMPYLAFEATIGRNSAFVNLDKGQREELGGIEYRSLKLLRRILLGYFFGFHLLGLTVFTPWIVYTYRWAQVVIEDGVDPSWWGIFTAASMFNDLGLTLTPDSMISFNTATLILLLGSYLIIIGNTGFPVMLRFIIWVLSKVVTKGSPTSDELQFLLDHPRRCFTLLFPSRANWWLFWVLVLFNVIDLVFFIILDLDDDTVTQFPAGLRVLNGWFQATSTRTAGFSSVNIANLHPAIQVSYMIMMYISVLPIAISVRRTNVYEEKSLGLWGGEEQTDMENPSYVGQHLRRQLSFDLWYIFLGFFIIAIVEGPRLQAMDDPAFSMFAVLFEIVSAYGTVGLSLGYPTINASFSAEFHTLSKLVIVAMMIRGRHRGLPYALDRAILLPSEKQYEKEAEDADRRHERRNSMFPDNNRSRTWEADELDENGLPRQHTGERAGLERRGSSYSNMSNGRSASRNRPRKGLGTLLSMGLTAGPTWHKDD